MEVERNKREGSEVAKEAKARKRVEERGDKWELEDRGEERTAKKSAIMNFIGRKLGQEAD